MIRKILFEYTYDNPKYRLLFHIAFWLLLFGIYCYFSTITFGNAKDTTTNYLLAAKSVLWLASFFYIIAYFLWPRFFAVGKWMIGLLLFIIFFMVLASVYAYLDKYLLTRCTSCMAQLSQNNPDYYRFLQSPLQKIVMAYITTGGLLVQLLIQLSLPTAIKMVRSYFRQTLQQLQLAKDNLQLEFNFLKAQVSPHFLFNTLNNIYSLVMSNRKEQAAENIARLSDLMRYTLYETSNEKILLSKEITLLKDYVELEKLRLNSTVVTFTFYSDSEDYTLPPLLFMPALENAFKYAADNKADSKIIIDITAKNQKLQVHIQNKFDPQRSNSQGGIGLQNLQKRLRHYYPGKSSYTASAIQETYTFELSCQLL